MKRTKFLGIVLTVVALVTTACGGSSSKKSATGSTKSSSSAAPTPIKLGFLVEQSGPVAVVGTVAIPAMQLAVKKVNDAGGFTVAGKKYTFDLDIKDNKSDASASAAAATGMVDDDGVKFIFGPTTSDTSPGVAQIVLPKGVLMFSPGTALQTMLTPDKLTTSSETLFRTNWSPEGIGAEGGAALRKAFPNAKTIAFVMSDSGSSKATAPVTKAAAIKEGFTVVDEETVPATATDFQTVLTKVKAKNPDVIFTGSETAVDTGVIKQAVDLGITAGIAYSNQPVAIPLKTAIGKPVPIKTLVVGQPAVLENSPSGTLLAAPPTLSSFANDLKTQVGKDVGPGQAIGFYYYDFVALLAKAMQSAGTVTDTKAISKALASGVSVDGALGSVAFTKGHVTNTPAGICVTEASSGTPTCSLLPPPGI